jgi:hypothetical protein
MFGRGVTRCEKLKWTAALALLLNFKSTMLHTRSKNTTEEPRAYIPFLRLGISSTSSPVSLLKQDLPAIQKEERLRSSR